MAFLARQKQERLRGRRAWGVGERLGLKKNRDGAGAAYTTLHMLRTPHGACGGHRALLALPAGDWCGLMEGGGRHWVRTSKEIRKTLAQYLPTCLDKKAEK